MKIKMGCSLMILHILGSQRSGELSKLVGEILYLDGQLSIYWSCCYWNLSLDEEFLDLSCVWYHLDVMVHAMQCTDRFLKLF